MNPKQYLKYAAGIRPDSNRIVDEIYELEESIDGYASSRNDGMPRSSTYGNSKFEKLIDYKADLEAEIGVPTTMLLIFIEAPIYNMSDRRYTEIAVSHYQDGKTLKEIAPVIGCSERHTKRLHKAMLAELETKIAELRQQYPRYNQLIEIVERESMSP